MALERRDPVPPGRYSVFVLDAEAPIWRAWLTTYKDRVRPLLSVQKTGGDIVERAGYVIPELSNGTSNLFEVASDVPWVKLGLPTIETRSAEAWLLEEKGRHSCYWVWTEAGPSVVCDEIGPARISVVGTLAPWAIAAFLGWAFINRKGKRP